MFRDGGRLVTDDELIHAMFDRDPAIARIAKQLYDERHAGDPKLPEPPHCDECFEGCPKCQPKGSASEPASAPRLGGDGLTRAAEHEPAQ